MIQKLTQRFKERYSKQFTDLNKAVVPAALVDDAYIVPGPVLGKLGGTVFAGLTRPELNPPASVATAEKRTPVYNIIYRIAIPYEDCETMANNDSYFNSYFDDLLKQALSNYAATVGGADKVRFGSHYISFEQPNGAVLKEEGEVVILELNGRWGQEL